MIRAGMEKPSSAAVAVYTWTSIYRRLHLEYDNADPGWTAGRICAGTQTQVGLTCR